MVTVATLVHIVLWICILGLIVWLLWWMINYINPPEPFKKVATVVLVVVSVLILITFLAQIAGFPLIAW